MGFPDLHPFLMVAAPYTPSVLPESMPKNGLPFRKAYQIWIIGRPLCLQWPLSFSAQARISGLSFSTEAIWEWLGQCNHMNPKIYFPVPDLDFENMHIEKLGWPCANSPLYWDTSRNSKLWVCEDLWDYEKQTAAKEVLIFHIAFKTFIKRFEMNYKFLN